MKLLITGASGMLGYALRRQAADQKIDFISKTRHELDITRHREIATVVSDNPDIDVVINAAGIVRTGRWHPEERMALVNTAGPHILSGYFPKVVQISTDCVFDGFEGNYTEASIVSPLDLYGVTKVGGELYQRPDLTIRGSFIGFGKDSFIDRMLLSAKPGADIKGFVNYLWNGFYVDTFAALVLQFARMDMSGLVHAVGPTVTKYEVLRDLAKHIRPDITVRAEEATIGKTMVLQSVVVPAQENIIGLNYSVTWENMLNKMVVDYGTHADHSVDPGRAAFRE